MSNDKHSSAAPALGVAVGSALTRADKDALARMPDNDWFGIDDLSFMIRNPRWRCDRLTAAGYLKSKVIGEYPNELKTVYRKKPNVPDQPRP